jgi:hypothetical protein
LSIVDQQNFGKSRSGKGGIDFEDELLLGVATGVEREIARQSYR